MNPHDARRIILRVFIALLISTILFSPIFTIPVSAQTGTIRFETISTEQGLSQSTVHAILQDQRGFLWFATEEGLDKFDGTQFTVFKHDPENASSLSDNIIYSMVQGRDGALWIGTSIGLDRFDPKTGSSTHYPQDSGGAAGFGGKLVSAVYQDRSGILWVGTDGGGLAAFNPAGGPSKIYLHAPGDTRTLFSNAVNAIFEDRTGQLWIGTDAGLDRFDRATGQFVLSFERPTSRSAFIGVQPVYAIAESSRGDLWVGTAQGLFQWDSDLDRLVEYRHQPQNSASLSDDTVTCILEDALGNLWIGTRNGLDLFDPAENRFTPFHHNPNDPHSLASNSIRSIYEDRSGVLWVGTSAGLSKYARATQKFSLYTHIPGAPGSLSDDNVWSVLEDRSGGLWVGTFASGLDHLDPATGTLTVYQNDPADPRSLAGNEIRALLEDHSGNLWVGMERGGLDRFDPLTNSFVHYRHDPADPASLGGENVFAIYEDRLGRLWVGTSDGGLDNMDPAAGTFTHNRHDPVAPTSLSNDNVRVIYRDYSGVFWLGTFGGVNLSYDHGLHFINLRHDPQVPSSLSTDPVASIYEDNLGTVWIGTFGGGLNRFDRSTQSFAHFTVKDGLPDDTIYCILADTDGNLWMSTNKGLSRFNPAAKSFRNYDISDGLQGNQFNPGACFQALNGEMFFGGTRGLNAFFPRLVKDNTIPPQVVITAVKKYNQTIQTDLASGAALQLSYKDNFISFEFAALDYNAPEKNQYAYMLEGVEKDWVQAGTRNYASYTNLQAGDYTFRVKAANNDGVWDSTGTAIQIRIIPPFWQTWWFIGLVCLVAGAGAFGGYRLRVSSMEARNRELVKRVGQRTHELATLNTISEVVNRSLDLTQILDAALDKTIEVMRMDGGLAYRLEETGSGTPDGPILRLLAHRGVADEYINLVRVLPFNQTFIRETVKTGKPDVRLVNNHPNPQIRKAIEQARVRLAINVPLLVQGKLVGALTLASWEVREITQEELSLLMAISQQVGMAVVNAQLYEQAEQTAITTERSRLARELHDSVTQLLYSVTLYAEASAELLASGKTEAASGHLHDLRDTAQEALREMRLLIFELHRPALGKGGLAAALQARLDAVEKRGGMRAELLVEGSERIPPPVQAELYNIAHEALNNALKHAHANNVQIRLRFSDAMTEMDISDDGVGFEPTPDGSAGGFGIPGMHERAQKIGGTLQIESAPGKGTRVIVNVPAKSTSLSNQSETEPLQKGID